MPVKRTPSPSILQSSSRYKAKPLCDGPLVTVLLRLAQTHQHLLVKNIKCHKFTRNCVFVQVLLKYALKQFGKNQRFEGVLSRNCFEKRRASALNTFVFSELFSVHFNKYLIFIKDIKPYPERGYKLRTYHLILRCL